MILLCGIASESPVELVRERLEESRTPYAMFHQRRFEEMELRVEGTGGVLTIAAERYRLEDFIGVYVRLMDDRRLPELAAEPPESPRRARCRELHDALMQWCEIAEARVVNRARASESNMSKPYQAQIIREHGFPTPETLITSDPEAVREFRARHGRVIFKSISGARSIVQELGDQDLGKIRSCPVQFQAYVEGEDVRVHTVGRDVFATRIRSKATDYRYSQRLSGAAAELDAVELSDDVRAQCLALSADLGLGMAGIDLRIGADDEVYCFEVNPSPAYSYYESGTGQPISAALARYLAGE